jgi:hypothetical protein
MTIEQFNGKVLKRIREIEQEMAAVREKERIVESHTTEPSTIPHTGHQR